LLAKPFRQRVRNKTRGDVGRAARSKADDDSHRMRRIGLAPRKPDGTREGGRSCQEIEKRPEAKFHDVIPKFSETPGADSSTGARNSDTTSAAFGAKRKLTRKADL
jgi:hypothetical protein